MENRKKQWNVEICKHCKQEIEYEISANFIVFCPHCKKYVFLQCEYGYGPVVPCRVLLGREEIAMITDADRRNGVYRYDSDKFDYHRTLQKKASLEALMEAKDLTGRLLCPEIENSRKNEQKEGAHDGENFNY